MQLFFVVFVFAFSSINEMRKDLLETSTYICSYVVAECDLSSG